MERRTAKMNISFSVGNYVLNTVLKFFYSNNPILTKRKPKNWFWGTFSPISVVLLGRLFSKTIGFTHVWTRTNHVKFMKIGLKLWTASCVFLQCFFEDKSFFFNHVGQNYSKIFVIYYLKTKRNTIYTNK